uniref:Uncharacterized protein n=1 Tax=Desulfobacca acetoxidans TaxID=60893 RepID=A0A7C5ALX6_9BACT
MAVNPSKAEPFTLQELESLQEQFLALFLGPKRVELTENLDLARAGYRLRDENTMLPGKIKAQFLKALQEYQRRGMDLRALPPAVQALWRGLT